jgi:hypothetical protein
MIVCQFTQKFRVKPVFDKLRNDVTFPFVEPFCCSGRQLGGFFYANKNVASVAVSMHQVVLHQHGKKRLRSDIGDDFVHIVIVAFVKAYRFSLNELLDQYFVGRLRMHFWESNIPFIN